MIFETGDWQQKIRNASLDELSKIFSHQNILDFIKQNRQQSHISPDQFTQNARALEDARKFQKQLKNDLAKFTQKVHSCRQDVKNKITDKFTLLKQISNSTELRMQQTNEKVKNLKESIEKNKKRLDTEEKWLKRTKEILNLEMNQQGSELQRYKDSVKSCQLFNDLVSMFNDTIEEREQRKQKVQQFIKKTKKPAISIDTPQPILKKAKVLPNSSRPEIEFIPENKELIFNVWTFEGQTVQFILFFDPESKKFGLKNPSKTFHSADLNCIRAFNFHRSLNEFYQQLCLLVSRFIDDADDLPIYHEK